MASTLKYNGLAAQDLYLSQGKFQQKNGTLKLGTSVDTNVSNISNTRAVVLTGSAYTQGNKIRSLFNLNDNGSIIRKSTLRDKAQVIATFPNTFKKFPTLLEFPYLYPIQNDWNIEQVQQRATSNPVYLYNGKGLGEIKWRNNGEVKQGTLSQGQEDNIQFYNGLSGAWHSCVGEMTPKSAPKNIEQPTYPTSGLLYSGHLVQLDFEKEDTSQTWKNVRVIPYQNGRGIQQYDPTKEYFGGKPFGDPIWPGTSDKIPPVLSHGANPANNNACVGVVLDSEGNEKSVIYKPLVPPGETKEELDELPWTPWSSRPAPLTVEAKNISFSFNKEKIFSPGPNGGETYWAPWPKFYAYQPSEPTPVQMNGLTSLKIGAAYNIGMQAYYEPDVEEGDSPINNPKYVSVSVVPLFQGEKICTGTDVYATAMGNVITWDKQGFSPYPTPSYSNVCGNWPAPTSRDARSNNPWWDWSDSTFGATGWASTPAFLLSSIPDQDVSIIETKENVHLPYLNQSNQGSVIVQAVSTVDPSLPEGSGRMKLLSSPEYSLNTDSLKFKTQTKWAATPGRALSVGNSVQEITGSGKWNYSGVYNITQTNFVNGWGVPAGTPFLFTTKSLTGVGSGAIVSAEALFSGGPVSSYSLTIPGSGYVDGEIIQLRITGQGGISYSDSSFPNWIQSTCFKYRTSGPSIEPYVNGTKYKSGFGIQTQNLTKNNLIVSVQSLSGVVLSDVNQIDVEYLSNPSYYPSQKSFRIDLVGESRWSQAVLEVEENLGNSLILKFSEYTFGSSPIISTVPIVGDIGIYPTGKKLYNTRILNQPDPIVDIVTDTDTGEILNVNITDMGVGQNNGDLIIVQQPGSDNNFIFELNLPSTDLIPEKIKGGTDYLWYDVSVNNSFDSPLKISNAKIYKQDGTQTNTNFTLNFATLAENRAISLVPEILNPSPPFDGVFGETCTVGFDKPIPPVGEITQAETKLSTFVLEPILILKIEGTGYTVGAILNTTGGSGNGLVLQILKTGEGGSVKDVKLINVGTGYKPNDTVILTGGNNDSSIILKVFPTEIIGTPLGLIGLGAGSGYTVGGPFTTISTGSGTGMTVNILDVTSLGEVTTLEVVDQGINYTQSEFIEVQSGGFDCLFRVKFDKRVIKNFTDTGTQYTTATNVPTFNVTLNSFFPQCDIASSPGQCLVVDVTFPGSNNRPEWDLKRYQVGDILAFQQDNNTSATAEIISMDDTKPEVIFNQLTPGTGYTPGVGFAYTQSINLNVTPTTVDIVADSQGFVKEVKINTLGDRFRWGDFLMIDQPGSGKNCVIKLVSERDVPPSWQPFINNREATASEWNDYKINMKSAVNLLDKQILTEMYPNYPQYHNESWSYYGDGGIKNDPNIEITPCSIL